MRIADIDLGDKPLFLAPMEDVTDPSFRYVCKRFGADMVYTEFISSDGLIRDAAKSVAKLRTYDYERPVGIQLYGNEIEPMVDQIEFYPGRIQTETLENCLERDLVVEAWSPLGRGKTLTNEVIAEIGARYGKSNAQVCLRWLIQLGMLPLPKSGNIERMKQNLEVFDFELTLEEMAVISAQENPTGRFWDADEIDF